MSIFEQAPSPDSAKAITLYMRLEYAGLLAAMDFIAAQGLKLDANTELITHTTRVVGTTEEALVGPEGTTGEWFIAVNRSEAGSISIRGAEGEPDLITLEPGEPCCFRLAAGVVPFAIASVDASLESLTLSVIEAPFVFSGQFPFLATSSPDLHTYLGIDGTISPALPDGSHLWQMEAVPSDDIGSLSEVPPDTGDPFTYDFLNYGPGPQPPTVTTDPDFGSGVRNVLDFVDDRDLLVMSQSRHIPNPDDGTESFFFGGVMRIDSLTGANAFINILSKRHTGNHGYELLLNRADLRLRWSFRRNITSYIEVTCPLPIVLGEAFAYLVSVDFGGDKIQIMTSAPGSYAENGSIPGVGTFSTERFIWIGRAQIAGLTEGPIGPTAQIFSNEWPAGTDAQLTEANMTNFLEYCDGVKTV